MSIELIATHPNLLVQRTLSKDCALAGLRVGYGLGLGAAGGGAVPGQAPFQRQRPRAGGRRGRVQPASAWRAMSVDRVRDERARLEHALAGWVSSTSRARPTSSPPGSTWTCSARPWPPRGRWSGRAADLGLPGWARISIGWAPQMAVLRSVLYSRLRHRGPDRTIEEGK